MKNLEKLMGKPVTLKYRQYLAGPARISTQYVVEQVIESPIEPSTKEDK